MVIGDLNAKVGDSNFGREAYMGKHGVGHQNDNGIRFADFCAENELVIGGTLFPHKTIHKTTWNHPDGITKNQIDHIALSRKWRRSLLDVRVKRGADIDSDHMLLMAELRLKLAAHKTISEKTTALYNISKLEEPETSEAYTQELKNKYNSLDVNDLDVNGNWEAIKSAFQVVGESVLGFRRRDTKPWMSKSTWELIEQRRKTKETLIQLSKNSPTYEEQNLRYSLLRKSLKRSVRRDRRNNTNLIADQAQKAAAAKNMAGIYKATKTLLNQSGHRSNTKPLKNENGDLLTTSEQQLKRWFTHFRDLLETGNPESSDIIPLHSHHPKLSNFNVEHPNCIEIKQAIDSLKCRKAPGKDRITAEMLRVDSTFTAKMLFPLLKQIWETETAPDDWKEDPYFKDNNLVLIITQTITNLKTESFMKSITNTQIIGKFRKLNTRM
ncbi:unnamed protein product [Colias eurytheme]|nr:unnamed protein product [Colias eurytheme]